jgi:hypothetical protein
VVRFDAYTATTSALKPTDALAWMFGAVGGVSVHQGRGFHRFGERVAVKNHAGDEVGAVQWGGSQGDRVMVEVKGDGTPTVVERLRTACEHRCTRVDSCVDFERPGAFEELLEPVTEVKAKHRLYGQRLGDWDQPELGRTVFLGAASSPIRARLYEKGKQPEFRHLKRPDLARLEIQVRPQKDAKSEYSRLSAVEVWGASKWTRELAESVLSEFLDAHPPGTVRKDSSHDQKSRWMVKQYAAVLVQIAADCGGWKEAGLTLGEMVREELAQRRRSNQ